MADEVLDIFGPGRPIKLVENPDGTFSIAVSSEGGGGGGDIVSNPVSPMNVIEPQVWNYPALTLKGTNGETQTRYFTFLDESGNEVGYMETNDGSLKFMAQTDSFLDFNFLSAFEITGSKKVMIGQSVNEFVDWQTSTAAQSVIWSYDITEQVSAQARFRISAYNQDGNEFLIGRAETAFYRKPGQNAVVFGTPTLTTNVEAAIAPSWTVEVDSTSNKLKVKVTGIATEDWYWRLIVEFL